MSGMNALETGLRPVLLALALTAGVDDATLASSSNATASAAPSTGAVVHIKDFAFAPTPLTIHAGDRVTFVNDDDEAHTVTATDKSFDSEGLDGAGTWRHAFAKAGTYRYFCELHPYMKATIVVLPSVAPANAGSRT
jgi:plastocyanin